MNISALKNQLVFDEFIGVINLYLHIKAIEDSRGIAELLERTDINYIDLMLRAVSSSGSYLEREYKKKTSMNFYSTLCSFLYEYRKNIDYERITPNSTTAKVLEKYLFSKYKLTDWFVFMKSLKFIKYNEEFLMQMLDGNMVDESQKRELLKDCFRFQKDLSRKFIMHYYEKFINDNELCYWLVGFQKEIFNLDNDKIFHKIKNNANEFRKDMNE